MNTDCKHSTKLTGECVKCGERPYETTKNTTNQKKAIVRQSLDKQWPKWAVIYPDRETRWFDAENQALLAADDYNGERYL